MFLVLEMLGTLEFVLIFKIGTWLWLPGVEQAWQIHPLLSGVPRQAILGGQKQTKPSRRVRFPLS